MFRHVLVADWSARSRPAPARPVRDAIWWHATWLGEPRYCRTQAQAEEEIREALSTAPGPVLAGFDFCFALPAWAMHRLGGWRGLWKLLADPAMGAPAAAALSLNRLLGGGPGGPFWGCREIPRKPRPYCWTEFRDCELRLKRRGLHPKPVFQLSGAGAVGAQSLAGVGVLERLRRRLGARVWPFEPAGAASVLFAEVWPGLLGRAPSAEPIPDRWQVLALAEALQGAALPQPPPVAKLEGWIAELPADPPHPQSATLNGKS